ncbi:MAG TPA: hypothetical protein VKI19_10890 [Acidimicrobiales bacterium]|nr:hypothetical protein [Acidimicrobiales bacterium]
MRDPWTPGDHLAVLLVNGTCGAALLAAWIGAALQTRWESQMGWLEGAIFAVITAAVADCIWLIQAMSRTRSARREVIRRSAALTLPALVTDRPIATAFWSAPRMTTFHLRDCPVMAGKAAVPVAQADPAGLRACRMCQP